MQNLDTGEFHELDRATAMTVDSMRKSQGNALLQVAFKGVPVPPGSQGPVFRVGEEVVLAAQPSAQIHKNVKRGSIVVLNIEQIERKCLVLRVNIGGHALDIFTRGQVVEIKGGRFRVSSAGVNVVILEGLAGIMKYGQY